MILNHPDIVSIVASAEGGHAAVAIDLTAKQPTARRIHVPRSNAPRLGESHWGRNRDRIHTGANGQFYVSSGTNVYQFNARLEMVGQSTDVLEKGQQLEVVHRGRAFVANADRLKSIPMKVAAVDR